MEIKCLLIYAEVIGSEGGEERRQCAPVTSVAGFQGELAIH